MFSILTSKIFGGTTIFLALAFAALLLSKNAVIHSQDKQITTLANSNSALRVDLATARGNAATLQAALDGQSAKVQAVSTATNAVAKAGAAAVAAAQKGQLAVTKAAARINALPATTCADADNILLEGAK